jgi:hypothetical protein
MRLPTRTINALTRPHNPRAISQTKRQSYSLFKVPFTNNFQASLNHRAHACSCL